MANLRSKKQDNKFSQELEESTTPNGIDPVLDWMRERNFPLTKKLYLELNYPTGVPDPLPAEIEASIPRELTD